MFLAFYLRQKPFQTALKITDFGKKVKFSDYVIQDTVVVEKAPFSITLCLF
jgi:hypothetical protein